MKNDPIIHAQISKIMAIFKSIVKEPLTVSDESRAKKDLAAWSHKVNLFHTALASLESSEREVSNQIIIDATNTIRSVLNNWQDAFESDFIKAQDALDFIQRSIPSERELLEGFKAHIKKYRGTEYELNIDQYLAEKQSKTETK